ncbi:fluoride efflux transporter FluC [Fructilactobacillus florum]|uniref:Fluoride-specific ion channel FluC n=1 Tax=Fructilactobacillus florum DSM 22689 = JCM 16035 TaxID=1423745 RepID=A0A0R2CUG2_9LACO|nr:CrcB family protein [Fructilactobacillus florum]KRM91867.1 hypothetical protein FC87_GL000692 [Fructilactobacillus florum DSM 22689 = JCM 16035]
MGTRFVFGAGLLGGLARLEITQLINYHQFPIATLLINLTGAFLLPIWTNYGCQRLGLSARWNQVIGTGLIGSFTTFSGIILDSLKLLEVHNYSGFTLYLSFSIILGLLVAVVGDQFSHILAKRMWN